MDPELRAALEALEMSDVEEEAAESDGNLDDDLITQLDALHVADEDALSFEVADDSDGNGEYADEMGEEEEREGGWEKRFMRYVAQRLDCR